MGDVGRRLAEGPKVVDLVIAVSTCPGSDTGHAAGEGLPPVHVDPTAWVALLDCVAVMTESSTNLQRMESTSAKRGVVVRLHVRLFRGIELGDDYRRSVREEHTSLQARRNSGDAGRRRQVSERRGRWNACVLVVVIKGPAFHAQEHRVRQVDVGVAGQVALGNFEAACAIRLIRCS